MKKRIKLDTVVAYEVQSPWFELLRGPGSNGAIVTILGEHRHEAMSRMYEVASGRQLAFGSPSELTYVSITERERRQRKALVEKEPNG